MPQGLKSNQQMTGKYLCQKKKKKKKEKRAMEEENLALAQNLPYISKQSRNMSKAEFFNAHTLSAREESHSHAFMALQLLSCVFAYIYNESSLASNPPFLYNFLLCPVSWFNIFTKGLSTLYLLVRSGWVSKSLKFPTAIFRWRVSGKLSSE